MATQLHPFGCSQDSDIEVAVNGNGWPGSQRGAVFVTGLLLLALISVVATTGYIMSTTDVQVSEAYKYEEQAFNNAEAGVFYALTRLEQALVAGMVLPESGGVRIPEDTAPIGYSFSLSSLTVNDAIANSYHFSVTGSSSRNAFAVITVGIQRIPAIRFGIFGDKKVDSDNNAFYYSYDSRLIADPGPDDSRGECRIAGNQNISFKANTFIDGDVILGNDGSTDAFYDDAASSIITGEAGKSVGPIEPDPLNVDSNTFRSAFDNASVSNDNVDISPYPGGDKIVHPGVPVWMPGKSGGSVYYLEEIHLENSDEININAADGPVTIYIRGTFRAAADSKINVFHSGPNNKVVFKITEDPVNPVSPGQRSVHLQISFGLNETGPPTGFAIFTDSRGILDFHNASAIKGLIYAPHAKVRIQGSGTYCGAIWAGGFEAKEGFEFYFDTALKDTYFTNRMGLTSWKWVNR